MRQAVGRMVDLGNRPFARYLNRMAAFLSDRAVIALSGPEAGSFLQGLVTNDVNAAAPDRPVYAALLTPQGKILFDFLVHKADGGLFVDCRKTAREALMKRLMMYRLRAKVDITARDDLVVVPDGGVDPRLPTLGGRGIVPAGSDAPDDTDYLARRLALGIPEGEDFGSDRMFAMDAGLDELHAISFTKGCYVGQELTARMKHRGKDGKRLLMVSTTDGAPLPAKDTAVVNGEVELGQIASTYGHRGFALVRLDRLAEATSALTADAIPVTIVKPDWLA